MAGVQPRKNAEKAGLVKTLRKQFPLEMLLQLIGLKRSTFFYHLSDKVDKNAEVVQKITEVFHKNNGNYGYRCITLVLRRIWIINHKRVQAIMQKWGFKGKCKLRKYHFYQGEVGKIAENLLQRAFQASAPNEKWVTDGLSSNVGKVSSICPPSKIYLMRKLSLMI